MAFVKNHKIRSGRSGRFEKGFQPWNNGLRGTGICKPNSGTFAKGHVPANTRDLGAERIDNRDGYVLVKVAEPDPFTASKARFKHKHREVWERHHGPVPPGMLVRFADGDRTNCDISNLVLVSRQEHQVINCDGLSRLPAEVMPSAIAYARMRVKMFKLARKTMRDEEQTCQSESNI